MSGFLRKILAPIVFIAAAVAVFFAVIFDGNRNSDPISQSAFKLNTVVTITIYDSQDTSLLQNCMELCDHYEQIFSRTLPDSEIARLNRGELADADGYSTLSSDTAALIEEGLRYSARSDGAFDLTIGAVSSLWDFTSSERHVPSADSIEQALPYVGWEQLEFADENRLYMPEGVKIDPGAIAKGYIADRLKEYLISEGVESATINLGGNVLCIGSKPGGDPFRIGVQKPFADRSETVGILDITDCSVVSSGIYERYFEEDGKFYHHILDPATGYPCENSLSSVTIISESSVEGDALSTACFALGLEKGLELVESLPGVEAIFIEKDGTMHFSDDFSTSFVFAESDNASDKIRKN
ncbi:MAG: FAD:protein FMN transferase [Candidatus Merdivicinus sp.]|jgi:thiamine biosynthesis lipoprotein